MPLPDSIQKIDDIDWPELRIRAMRKRSRKKKSAKNWDERAESFAERVQHNPYIAMVMEKLPLTPETTVLDIGCGPGTLALPIARKVAKVTALDFSAKMLEILEKNARKAKVKNISTAHLSWEDDWQQAEIGSHDITLASRSTAVDDLPAALRKLNAFAKKAVFLTDRVSPTPFEPEAFAAVGLDFEPGPDYIYTLNILHSMNIMADVTILEFDREKNFSNMEQALAGFLWMFDELTEQQTALLKRHLFSISRREADGSITVTRTNPPKWALISWKKE